MFAKATSVIVHVEAVVVEVVVAEVAVEVEIKIKTEHEVVGVLIVNRNLKVATVRKILVRILRGARAVVQAHHLQDQRDHLDHLDHLNRLNQADHPDQSELDQQNQKMPKETQAARAVQHVQNHLKMHLAVAVTAINVAINEVIVNQKIKIANNKILSMNDSQYE